ncbi:fungal-specific transcription factor-like protein [Diplocarpon rosae]|nr:fungal-specific transcription factor-like protein [Diplocarpon rosae]
MPVQASRNLWFDFPHPDAVSLIRNPDRILYIRFPTAVRPARLLGLLHFPLCALLVVRGTQPVLPDLPDNTPSPLTCLYRHQPARPLPRHSPSKVFSSPDPAPQTHPRPPHPASRSPARAPTAAQTSELPASPPPWPGEDSQTAAGCSASDSRSSQTLRRGPAPRRATPTGWTARTHAHAVHFDRRGGQRGEDAEQGVGDLERVREGHALVRGGRGEEALTHGGLPDDEAQPLLRDQDIGFLDIRNRHGRRLRVGELVLECGVRQGGGRGGCDLVPGVDEGRVEEMV